jgi:hypothetical protein
VADESSTLERIAWHVAAALEPLRGMLSSEDARREFVREELGIDVPDALQSIGVDLDAVDAVIKALDDLTDVLGAEEPDREALARRSAELAAAVASAMAGIADAGRRAADGLAPEFVAASRIVEQLPRRLLDWLIVCHIEDTNLSLLEALRVLAIVEVEDVEEDPDTFTTQHTRRSIELDRLTTLFTDPKRWLEISYGWGTDHATLERLLERLFLLAVAVGVPARLEWSDLQRAERLSGVPFDPEQHPAPPQLRLPLLSAETTGAAADAGLSLVVLPARDAHLSGLALLPFAEGALQEEIELDPLGEWRLSVKGTLDLQGGVGIVARPGDGPHVFADIDGEGAAASGVLEIGVGRNPSTEPLSLVTFGADSGLFVSGIEVRAAALLDAERAPELLIEAGVRSALLRVRMGEADGFLQSIVPDLDLTFDAGIGFSSLRGAYFVGGSSLEVTRAADRRIGPIHIRRIGLALRPPAAEDPPGLDALVGLGVALSIGPVTGVVDGIGMRLGIRQRPGGNLGPVDLDVSFKPPDGFGLEIASGPIVGGGFLFFDEFQSQYAGALELSGFGIAVKAVGVLTTKLPGGRRGYSLLIVISTEFTPVQLGLGFRLAGVGGLIGINRTVAIEALRSGLKTGALSAVLSPPDPIANAPMLVSTLSGLFPPAAGRHIFGPAVRIVWGTPTLVTIDLCVAIEVPSPIRLIVLGRLRALLPDERAPVVRLQMDMLGVLDVDRSEAAVDATLVDSRLAEFALTGDMALRLNWGSQSTFLLAVGGFHPRFAAPTGFPALKRVAVALASGDNPKLRLEAYLAMTSNTVQLGSRIDLAVKSGRFTVGGFLSFDALVTLSPLSFTVDIAGKLAVRAGGRTILSVSLALSLSGPKPWHARGKASFSILFFDVTFRFDVTIGERAPAAGPAGIDVAPLMRAALADQRSWNAQLPDGDDTLVTLRAIQTTEVLAHPLGTLQVRQRIAPLERTLERFGDNVPTGARLFRVASATIGGRAAAVDGIDDLFAPGQFRALSEEQKLSLPSFESMRAGATIGTAALAHGRPVTAGIAYEERIVTAEGVTLPVPEPADLPNDVFEALTVAPVLARGGAFSMRGLS